LGLHAEGALLPQLPEESKHRGNNRPTGSQVTQGTQVLAPLFHSSLASLVSPAEKEQCNNATDSHGHLQGCNLEPCRKDKLQCCNLHRFSAVRMQKGHDKHSLKAVCHALTRWSSFSPLKAVDAGSFPACYTDEYQRVRRLNYVRNINLILL
jgi:hypothetical protein